MTSERPGAIAVCGSAAVACLGRGWSVLALRSRDKRPLFPWELLQHEPATEASVRHWFEMWPDANLGIVTGSVSGLVVLDVDPAHGGDASLDALEATHAPWPSTVESVTGGGGRHLYFRHPGGLMRNRGGISPGLDLRGDGGYIVAPPSIHPNGLPYRWRPGHAPDDLEPAALPPWLLAVAVGRSTRSRSDWRRIARHGVAEGERNSTAAALAGHLLFHGVDPVVVRELLLAWNEARCRPPLPDAEVAAVVRNVTRLRDRKAAPVDPDA